MLQDVLSPQRLRTTSFFFYPSKTPQKCLFQFVYLLAFASMFLFRRCLRFENQIFSKSPHTVCATLEHFEKSFLILKEFVVVIFEFIFSLNNFKTAPN